MRSGGFNVSCVPLQAMVDATGLLDINLLSLDVEGGELSVLRTLDLEATNIQVVVVELDGRSPDRDEEVGCIRSRRNFAGPASTGFARRHTRQTRQFFHR